MEKFTKKEQQEYDNLIAELKKYPDSVSALVMLAQLILKKEGIESEDI